jgi:hypothetical protein
MKLYKQTVVFKNDDGAHTETRWSGSQADASAQRSAWTKAGAKRADITTEEVDVPTDKKGLLAFLNAGSQ